MKSEQDKVELIRSEINELEKNIMRFECKRNELELAKAHAFHDGFTIGVTSAFTAFHDLIDSKLKNNNA